MITLGQKHILFISLLRITIGWHFLYNGIVKLLNPVWTSKLFLASSKGPLSDFFRYLIENENIVCVIDHMNKWGLIAIGLGLFIGLFARPAALFGILLLALYYMAYPPFPNIDSINTTNGHYIYVNQNLIELVALIVIYIIPTSFFIGFDRIMVKLKYLNWIYKKKYKTLVNDEQ